jgi:signal peptidase I
MFYWIMMVCILSGSYLLFDRLFLIKKRLMKHRFIKGCEFAFLLSLIYLSVMWYNFEFTLAIAVIITGVICLLDRIWFSKKRKRYAALADSKRGRTLSEAQKEYVSTMSLWVEYARSFFLVLLIVLFIRTWFLEAFRIPTGSLEPTLLVGDLVLVNKFEYGLRVPVENSTIIPIHHPKRGDIVVFRWPVDTKIDFIKRLVGMPGDTLSYIDKVLYVNGKEASQTYEHSFLYDLGTRPAIDAYLKQETLMGVTHEIYQFPSEMAVDFKEFKVPEGMYFMMGDNRDDSADSRFWGLVSEDQLMGKAQYVIMSFDGSIFHPRWDRFGKKIR